MSFLSNKKLRRQWYEGLVDLMNDLDAKIVGWGTISDEYELDTRFGKLSVSVPKDSEFMSVCCRFEEPKQAIEGLGNSQFMGLPNVNGVNIGGKWNYHSSVSDGKQVKPAERGPYVDAAIAEVKRRFDKVVPVTVEV